MNKIQENRLLKLAQHLETGKLGHKKFDFSIISEGPRRRNGCGTAGCAMGEMPIVFPRAWKFEDPNAYRPIICRMSGINKGLNTGFREWFGITTIESDHLFLPGHQKPRLFGGRSLDVHAKKSSVAKNMRAFIEKKHSMVGDD